MEKEKKGRKKGFSFEGSMERLDRIVKDLESGELSLEQSLEAFEQGIKIYQQCRGYLEDAKQRIEVLLAANPGEKPVLEPYEEDVSEDEENDGEEGEDE